MTRRMYIYIAENKVSIVFFKFNLFVVIKDIQI